MRYVLKAAFGAAFLLSGPLAFGQGAVQQCGLVIPGNAAQWLRNGCIADSGVPVSFIKSLLPFVPGSITTTLNMTGQLTQSRITTWAGGYPNGNVGVYTQQQYTGVPTGGFNDTGGLEIPVNLIQVGPEQLAWNPSQGGVVAFEVQHYYGGGSAIGPRTSVTADCRLSGTIANSANPAFVCLQIYSTATAGVAGAASGFGNGLGSLWGIDMLYARITSGVFMHQTNAIEFGYQPQAGSSMDYSYGIDLINSAPAGYHANAYESALNLTGGPGFWNIGIDFGNPQAPGGGMPISPGGTAIHFASGTLTTVLDASAITASGFFLKGPAGFVVEGNNHVGTDQILSVTGNNVSMATNQGNPIVGFGGASSNPANYPLFMAGATVLFDGGPVSATLGIGTQVTTSGVVIGRSGTNTQLSGTVNSGSNAFALNTSQGNPLVVFGAATSNPASYPVFVAGSSVLIDAGPTSAALGLGTVTSSTGVVIGHAGGTTTIVGSILSGTFQGVGCSGSPTSGFVTVNGIVTHC